MKTVGLIGGMSWESTRVYYQLMNEHVYAQFGGHNSIEAIMYSVNFERILKFVHRDEWEAVGNEIASLAKKLEIAGAHFLLLTSNAIHRVLPQVQAAIQIPILHIADPTAKAIQKAGIKKVGLLGTKVSMEERFYKDRLSNLHGIEVVVPQKEDREWLQKIIFEELTVGEICSNSKGMLLRLIQKLGTQAVILGCTELTLLVNQKDTPIPLFDTTALHAKEAVELACR